MFGSSCQDGISIVSGVASLFVDTGKCDLWACEASLFAKYVMIAQSAAFTTSEQQQQQQQDDLSNIFLERHVWRRTTEGSTHISRFHFKLKQICWISIKNGCADPRCNVCLHFFPVWADLNSPDLLVCLFHLLLLWFRGSFSGLFQLFQQL